MSKIKVTETFYALQGEGRYVGTPSVFLRTFGCNLRCKNFGRSKEERFDGPNPEVAEVIKNIQLYKKLEELPLVSTGCDSYAAVYPEFKDFSKMWGHEELVRHLIDLTPNKKFEENVHLVITGGEPLLWQKQFEPMFECLYNSNTENDNIHITFETNGTQPISAYMDNVFATRGISVHFSVSPKLTCSGEKVEDAIVEDSLRSIYETGCEMDFKFVVATQEDLNEILTLRDNQLKHFGEIDIYLMPLGGLNESYQLNRTDVANLALKYGFKFSPRLQCDISGNQWST